MINSKGGLVFNRSKSRGFIASSDPHGHPHPEREEVEGILGDVENPPEAHVRQLTVRQGESSHSSDDDDGPRHAPHDGSSFHPFLLSAEESNALMRNHPHISTPLSPIDFRASSAQSASPIPHFHSMTEFYRPLEPGAALVPPSQYHGGQREKFVAQLDEIVGDTTYFQGKGVLWRDIFGQVCTTPEFRQLLGDGASKKQRKEFLKAQKRARKSDNRAFKQKMQAVFSSFECKDVADLFSPSSLPRLVITRSSRPMETKALSRVMLILLRYCVSKGEKKDRKHADRTVSIGGLTNRVVICANHFEIVTQHRTDFKPFYKLRTKWLRGIETGHQYSALHLLNKILKLTFESYEKALKRDIQRIDKYFSRAMIARHSESEELIERATIIKRRAQVFKRILQLQVDLVPRFQQITNQSKSAWARDVEEFGDQMHELAEGLENSADSLIGLHISVTEHKANNVLNTLNFVTAIFLPLSFCSGIYGMLYYYFVYS